MIGITVSSVDGVSVRSKRRLNVNAHDCGEIAGVFYRLREAGIQIGATPETAGPLLAMAERILNNETLWASAPAMMGGETKADQRGILRAIVDQSKS